MDHILNFQLKIFVKSWEFYTRAGCDGCNILHVCQGGNQLSKVVLEGANELPWLRCLQVSATLNFFLSIVKSGGLRGYQNKGSRGQVGYQVPNMVLGGANELPWPWISQIGAPLDALLPFNNQVF